MTLLPAAPLNETDSARRRRLAPSKKMKFKPSDHEAGDDSLTAALDGVWSHSAMWARAIRDCIKAQTGDAISLEHARDVLAYALSTKPLLWLSVIKSRPSSLLIAALVERVEDENTRILICPEIADHITIWGSETNARRAITIYGSDACRRRWFSNRVATEREIAALYPQPALADWLPDTFVR